MMLRFIELPFNLAAWVQRFQRLSEESNHEELKGCLFGESDMLCFYSVFCLNISTEWRFVHFASRSCVTRLFPLMNRISIFSINRTAKIGICPPQFHKNSLQVIFIYKLNNTDAILMNQFFTDFFLRKTNIANDESFKLSNLQHNSNKKITKLYERIIVKLGDRKTLYFWSKIKFPFIKRPSLIHSVSVLARLH